MIPFGLVAGFADGQEIRITELAEHGFCFRTLDEIREVKRFRICFYDGFNGMKTGDQEKKSRDPYTEVEIHSFEMEVRVEDGLGIPVYVYSVFVEQEKYRECAGSLILWYDRFVRLKLVERKQPTSTSEIPCATVEPLNVSSIRSFQYSMDFVSSIEYSGVKYLLVSNLPSEKVK